MLPMVVCERDQSFQRIVDVHVHSRCDYSILRAAAVVLVVLLLAPYTYELSAQGLVRSSLHRVIALFMLVPAVGAVLYIVLLDDVSAKHKATQTD
jgi:hypothetical protein